MATGTPRPWRRLRPGHVAARCARRAAPPGGGTDRRTGAGTDGPQDRPCPPPTQRRRHVHRHELQRQDLHAAAAGQGRLPAGSLRCGTAAGRPRAGPASPRPCRGPGECSAFKEQFMECLRHSGYESAACRERAMAYLECRMDRQLMANEPLEKLGFKDLINEKSEEKPEKL
ncbi:cytochrome c oxidase assembly protein COX19 isoform X1 [Pseudopipra pipra]|uniref:cytochrome c oxidase assembly protein COX19 isoform X1 n=1 Tax=Pseudopipra pipra TaxID=415032 RepID=UPI003138AEE2